MDADILVSVGYRHLLEDLLKVLRGEAIETERAHKVVEEMIGIVVPVVRGWRIYATTTIDMDVVGARSLSAYIAASKLFVPQLGDNFGEVMRSAEMELRTLAGDLTRRPPAGSAAERVANAYLAHMTVAQYTAVSLDRESF